MNKKLWTKGFTLLIISTILSAIGGEALYVPLSLAVFEKTQSAFLSSLMFMTSFLPDMLLSIFLGPVVDKLNKKKTVICLDILFVLFYSFSGFFLGKYGFQYGFLLAFGLGIAVLSMVYQLAFQSWYPDVMPKGQEQAAYSVYNLIYPLIAVAMAPISIALYKWIGLSNMFYVMAGALVLSICIESFIPYVHHVEQAQKEESYKQSLQAGFSYVKNHKGILYILIYVAFTNGISEASVMFRQWFFQSAPHLNEILLGTVISASMVARVIASALNTKIKVPKEKRYPVTKWVYLLYVPLTSISLFLGYPFIIAVNMLANFSGQFTATLRQAAFANYVERNMRARVNSIMGFLISVSFITSYLLAGIMGEIMPYRIASLLLAGVNCVGVYFLIIRTKAHVKPVYESERTEETEEAEENEAK